MKKVDQQVPDPQPDAAHMSAKQEPDELTIDQLEELRAIANCKPQEGEDEEDDLEAIIAGEKLRRLRIRQRAAAAAEDGRTMKRLVEDQLDQL